MTYLIFKKMKTAHYTYFLKFDYIAHNVCVVVAVGVVWPAVSVTKPLKSELAKIQRS